MASENMLLQFCYTCHVGSDCLSFEARCAFIRNCFVSLAAAELDAAIRDQEANHFGKWVNSHNDDIADIWRARDKPWPWIRIESRVEKGDGVSKEKHGSTAYREKNENNVSCNISDFKPSLKYNYVSKESKYGKAGNYSFYGNEVSPSFKYVAKESKYAMASVNNNTNQMNPISMYNYDASYECNCETNTFSMTEVKASLSRASFKTPSRLSKSSQKSSPLMSSKASPRRIPALSPLGLGRLPGGVRVMHGLGPEYLNIVQILGNPATIWQPRLVRNARYDFVLRWEASSLLAAMIARDPIRL